MPELAEAPMPQVKEPETKKQPPYNVILLNDNYHSYEYVIRLCKELFHMDETKAFTKAEEVDKQGRVILWTGPMEVAELKRDQIHAFGKDDLIAECKGSMSATIEPVA